MFAAIGYSPKPVREYDETDWTSPDTPGLPVSPLSKAVAERAAWDFIETERCDTDLVVINPTWVAGPTVTSDARSPQHVFEAMLGGHMPLAPRQRFGIADVRDVADAHRRAAMRRSHAARGLRDVSATCILADGPTTSW